MTISNYTADEVVQLGLKMFAGLPAYLAGSSVAAQFWGKPPGNDLDVFVHVPRGDTYAFGQCVARAEAAGFRFEDRMSKVNARWLTAGTPHWQTNSLKMVNDQGLEINLIGKTVNGSPITNLSDVLESFDFGLLAMGWETRKGIFRDMRSYQFGHLGIDLDGPLPMMLDRLDEMKQGLFSKYVGFREPGRLARYAHNYGYDMSLVIDALVKGYRANALYQSGRGNADGDMLANIYNLTADQIEDGEWDQILQAEKKIIYLDELDQIYEAMI